MDNIEDEIIPVESKSYEPETINAPSNKTDFIFGFAENIKVVLDRHKEYLGLKEVFITNDAVTEEKSYPYIVIQLKKFKEKREDIPYQEIEEKELIGVYDIIYYHGLKEDTLEINILSKLNNIISVFRENWHLNDYCSRLGVNVDKAVPCICDENISGATITLACRKTVELNLPF